MLIQPVLRGRKAFWTVECFKLESNSIPGGEAMSITKGNWITAIYFGLRVKVVFQLNQCSLILFRQREFIVETRDLVFGEAVSSCGKSLRKAA